MKQERRNKEIRCSNCGAILAEGHICSGRIEIDCKKCDTTNVIEVKPVEQKVVDPRENYIRKSA